MIDIPLIDELRATRQRLAQEHGFDVDRYGEMLCDLARKTPGDYVTRPLFPPASDHLSESAKNAG